MQRKDDQETESILTDQCKSTCKPVESRNEFNHNSNKENSVTTGSAFANLHQRKPKPVKSVVPKNRIDLLKWNGWGYKDSQFVVKDGIIHFTGDRYPIGELSLPYFTQFVMDVFKVDLSKRNVPQPLPAPEDFPRPAVAPEFAAGLRGLGISHSVDGVDRLVHAHGHTLRDVFTLRQGRFERIPDVVAWPGGVSGLVQVAAVVTWCAGCHEEVVALVRLAHEHNVVVIPFGGGTSVSGAVSCPAGERRTILSLDTSQMNRVLWLDGENLLACCEAGIIGQDLERELQSQGFTVGHEPDSYEFSSLGGWVATRASGMKKNLYGNIEDLLVHARTVTPAGVLEKACLAPRVSCGPDLHHLVLGSEGTLGVITEVMLKIRPLPACKKYGSVVFPDFESGVRCLREVARKRCQPASVRLMDNEQFRFGQSLRPVPGCLGHLLDGVKKLYLTRVKRFDPDTMCVATLLFEGEPHQVAQQETLIYALASQFGGIPAGEKNGERGYVMTFIIAYIRDLGLEYNIVAESFETSVCWDRTLSLCENVKHRLAKECKALGVKHYLVSCRVTQTYDSGCCVYFYFALRWTPEHADPLGLYERLEESAREEVLASGGSLSHHHGVGKLRARWFPGQVSAPGVEALLAAKRRLDPRDILACGNLLGSKL